MLDIDLKTLITDLKSYLGVTRKHQIADVVSAFPRLTDQLAEMEILADFGEDAAVLLISEDNDNVLLLAADGIMGSLMNSNPYWAGYCSVLVNLHDIAAMGGRPLALVDILSVKEIEVLAKVTTGMNDACSKFGVPIVGGHIHPDSRFNAVDVAVLGTAMRKGVIYSHTAEVGDRVIFAMDLDGCVHPDSLYSWDTTQHKSADGVRKQLLVMSELGSQRLVHSGKDISNPGTLGTLGMLLETSKKGAEIDLEKMPYPGDDVVNFTQWLKMYQGCGFVVTCKPENSADVIDKFRSVGLSSAVAGEITDERKLMIRYNDRQDVLFDFEHENITGIN